ncbi:hypothetical protein [Aphanizomenon flos-aquae]|jgi:hypothetical protein|uniref:Uncharacterized protein n=1 Tax=Aphanizomenon flos-aquae FACHB-1040 TaxID=2692887 RepID=A0ABR8BWP4_APHFL|nr:hypothetical protein [Aphanizomenon flos-aquae]MBD2278122.1 hypothetical protein [Aphanizomenon flos-aquae FACHB-1040]
MRKWRLFLITLISFIAILGENWLKKIIPISLCILLNSNSAACYINFNDGRVEAAISNINVTDNSSKKILTINQDLPTKQEDDFQHKPPSQIAIPPIIRPAETNLYLQNALPKDFRISSQIPYSSGKQEILLVSPSTGAEQLYTFNVPGSSSFQLFEVEYKKVSAIDFSSLTSTDSLIVNPEQIKSVLNRFKITFANNSLSKITLSDGTTANFSAGQAVIKSPQGQTVETVQISQNEFIDKNLFVSQARSKVNKNIGNNTTNKDANLLAKTSESACQAAVSSSLNVISDSLGLWGNKLTTSKSLIIKSVGWAISFGSGAIKSNISTKNPMLQEVNCRPPVQCEEQRVSGGSEIRTDLFQVAKGANRKVNLKFEFFEIPDRIELYFDGKQIFGVGSKSGPGNETFDLPTNAEYVGVKLIGNDNVNTRWWYVISCSGSQLAESNDNSNRTREQQKLPSNQTTKLPSGEVETLPYSPYGDITRPPLFNQGDWYDVDRQQYPRKPYGTFWKASIYNTLNNNHQLYRSIAQRHAFYDFADAYLETQSGAIKSRWFKAAAIVTKLNGIGAADLGKLNFILDKKTEDFMRKGNEFLFKFNMNNFKYLLEGQDIPNMKGLRGKALDYKLVEFEQRKAEEFIRNYNYNGFRNDIIKQVNLSFNHRLIRQFAPSEVVAVIREKFKPGEFDFSNIDHRITLGKGIIDKLYEKQ